MDRIKSLLFENYLIKLSSLFFAVMLWFFVTSKEGVERNLVVPLEFKNVPDSLVIEKAETRELRVRIQGKAVALNGMGPEDFRAVLDLKKAGPGRNHYFLDRSVIQTPKDVTVSGIDPREIEIQMDHAISKDG